jgi:hypothetical protein
MPHSYMVPAWCDEVTLHSKCHVHCCGADLTKGSVPHFKVLLGRVEQAQQYLVSVGAAVHAHVSAPHATAAAAAAAMLRCAQEQQSQQGKKERGAARWTVSGSRCQSLGGSMHAGAEGFIISKH